MRKLVRYVEILAVLAAIVIVVFLAGSPSPFPAPKNDPWKLYSLDPDDKVGTYLGNGFISTRVMSDGVGSRDGKPLPCYMAGFYKDEKLVPIPTWSDLRFSVDGQEMKLDKNAPYRQTLDMKSGLLITEGTWRAGRKRMDGRIVLFASRACENLGVVRVEMTPRFSGQLRTFSPTTSVGNNPAYELLLLIDNCGNSCKPPKKGEAATRTVEVLKNDIPFRATLYASVGEVGSAQTPTRTITDILARQSRAPGPKRARIPNGVYANILSQHVSAWAKLWKKDIVIEGSPEDQQAIHSCLFYLLSSAKACDPVKPGNRAWGIPPMGLSNTSFNGHVFWDADVWMFPALILQHPEMAASIVQYRYNTLPGAMTNAKIAKEIGARYAWESGASGVEDAPPGIVYREERHINGDVALAQWQYFLATGDLNWLRTRGLPVLSATADYWAARAVFVKDKNRYEIRRVVPPDENAGLVDNSVYTNAVAKMNLEFATEAAQLCGVAPKPEWAKVARAIYIGLDKTANRFVIYDNDKLRSIKQADAELLAFPLQFAPAGLDASKLYANTLDFYEPKILPNGPAMTKSVHAVIAARLGRTEQAYADFKSSWEPYFRGPFNYFNEKKSLTYNNACFLTGAAGPVMAVLYGFGGIHMDYARPSPLTTSAQLPKAWKSLRITGIEWQGKTYDLDVRSGRARMISRGRPAGQ
jgi:trehalose/maltose hydrolase-like predicted phosphorylase